MAARKIRKGDCPECGLPKMSKAELKRMKDQLASQANEIDELKNIAATVSPNRLVERLPEVCKDYYPQLCERVIASGMVGKSPDETRASLGLSKASWLSFQHDYPEFKVAVEQFKQQCRAYWFSKSREAMNNGNWQFQTEKVERLIMQMFKGEDMDALGDASKLVHITA